jgi:hypothetical protein
VTPDAIVHAPTVAVPIRPGPVRPVPTRPVPIVRAHRSVAGVLVPITVRGSGPIIGPQTCAEVAAEVRAGLPPVVTSAGFGPAPLGSFAAAAIPVCTIPARTIPIPAIPIETEVGCPAVVGTTVRPVGAAGGPPIGPIAR